MSYARDRMFAIVIAFVTTAVMLASTPSAFSATSAEIDRDVRSALDSLYNTTPKAKDLGDKAKGILVFPKVVKAGFIFGGQTGEGALLVDGEIDGYYKTGGVSVGLQAGAQTYGYALFLMSDADLEHLHKTRGWEIGVGPSVVVLDAGTAENLTTKTLKSGIYAFVFGQKGLMAGIGLQGNKIHRK